MTLSKRLGYLALAALVCWLGYTSLLSRSAMKDQHSADVITRKDAEIHRLQVAYDSLKGSRARVDSVYVYKQATSDARKPKTTEKAALAQEAVKLTGDSAAIKAVDSLVMAIVIERRAHLEERSAADSVIAERTAEIGNLTAQLALTVSKAEDQRRMDHRAVLREKARGGVAVASASGGAIIGAVLGGPVGAGIGAAVGGIASLVVGR